MWDFLVAVGISLIVAFLWHRLEPTRVGVGLSWALVWMTLTGLALVISGAFGYAAWLALKSTY